MKTLEEKSFKTPVKRWDSTEEKPSWYDEDVVKLSDAQSVIAEKDKRIEELEKPELLKFPATYCKYYLGENTGQCTYSGLCCRYNLPSPPKQ